MFDDVKELGDEDDDNEEEEEEGGDCNDDDRMVLNSFNRNHEQREDVRRDPLVRELCRLIELKSSWNQKLEEELKHLLKSLQVLTSLFCFAVTDG
jgi:hypothetical protein